MIGIVGGMGPYAGLTLVDNIFKNTLAFKDQDYIPVIMISNPKRIADRSNYLKNKPRKNPGDEIALQILKLESIGCNFIGIACNTAHVPTIFKKIEYILQLKGSNVKILNIISETIKYLKSNFSQIKKVGVFSTNGTYLSNVFHEPLINEGFNVFIPDWDFQNNVLHNCIYNNKYGIKTNSNKISSYVESLINKAVNFYIENNVELIIIGCTDFSFVFSQIKIQWNVTFLDSSLVLARSLIKNYNPKKLTKL